MSNHVVGPDENDGLCRAEIDYAGGEAFKQNRETGNRYSLANIKATA
jgi:hypothetical protein